MLEVNNINYTTSESNRQDRERSKREDLDCCKKSEIIDKLFNFVEEEGLDYFNPDIFNFVENLLQESKMRCSEHCGNTVREAQETSSPKEI